MFFRLINYTPINKYFYFNQKWNRFKIYLKSNEPEVIKETRSRIAESGSLI